MSAKTIKNKVAAPFRTVNFEIHFGKGIREHEQVFDVLRKYGECDLGEVTAKISGTSSWKSFLVSDSKTGEVKIEKKFYKADFNSLLENPEYSPYLEAMIEKAMTHKLQNDDTSVDTESYEEVRAIALDLQEELSVEA